MNEAEKRETTANENQGENAARRFSELYPDKYRALLSIQKRFNDAGFEIFLVGGALRNLVLGKEINDLDLASSAHPSDIMRMYKSVIPTGIKHGTVTLVLEKEHYEITTFRVDGEYSDARRPDKVSFTSDIHEDLKRRDFTINAMALDLHSGQLLDPHDGRGDIARRLIRTVGDPLERFFEDGLRIVRGIRFASQLGFDIDAETRTAMSARLDKLAQVSVERFRDELLKTLSSAHPVEGMQLMHDLRIDALFLPEYSAAASMGKPDRIGTPAARVTRALKALENSPSEPEEIRFATLLLALEDSASRVNLIGRLKLPNLFVKKTLSYAEFATIEYESAWTEADIRRFAASRGVESLEPQIDLMEAWRLSEGTGNVVALHDELRSRLRSALADRPALSIRELAIDGAGLRQLAGLSPGPQMGIVLEKLLQAVLENPALNTKETLASLAMNIRNEDDANPET